MDRWTFVHVTDIHVGSPKSYRFAPDWAENWQTARRQILEINPDLMLAGGDYTRDGAIHPFELQAVREDFDRLPFPWRAIPGNMDTGNKHATVSSRCQTKRDDRSLNVTSEQMQRFHAIFGESPWSFVHKNVRFTGLYAALAGSGLPEEERLWTFLEALPSLSCPRFHVVVMHYPLFVDSMNEPNYDLHAPEEYYKWYFGIDEPHRSRIFNIFKAANVNLVLSGHIHCRRAQTVEGIRFIKGPSTAMAQAKDFWADGDPTLGFMKLDVGEDHIGETFVPLSEVSKAVGYGPGGHPLSDQQDYSLAWEKGGQQEAVPLRAELTNSEK